jgi:hypothetical protein
MNPKLAKLLYEGFSISTLEKLDGKQLNALYKRVVEQSTGVLNIPKADTDAITKAKSEKKPFVTYEEEMEEGEMTEKAVSKQQQKIMGLALSVKRGDTPKSKVSKKVQDMAKKMSEKDLEDFASTKHKGLPKKKTETNEVKKLEEGILKLLEKHLPPHTTKGELIKMIKRKN